MVPGDGKRSYPLRSPRIQSRPVTCAITHTIVNCKILTEACAALSCYGQILIDKSPTVFDSNDRFLIQLTNWLVVNAKWEHVLDVLADVLANLRLRGQMYFRTEFVGSWGVTLPEDHNTIRIHLVVQGQCWVTVSGGNEPILLREGDFALVPHGAAQTLSDSPHADAVSLETLLNGGSLGDDGIFRHGNRESKQQARLVCGFCNFDEELNHPLFLGLPPILVMGHHLTGSAPWLAEAVRVITTEANLGGMGGSAVINRLMEVLFIQGIRLQCDSRSNQSIPFLLAITDKNLKPVIEAMHEHPERSWTLSDLAKLSNMSRGRFAQRFKEVLGQSPLQYLTDWRLQKAKLLLKESNLSIAEVGFRSGYQSLPSFTRRFGKQFGISPGAFRKEPRSTENSR